MHTTYSDGTDSLKELKLHELGIGNGSLKINKDIIDNWQIKYIVGQINK